MVMKRAQDCGHWREAIRLQACSAPEAKEAARIRTHLAACARVSPLRRGGAGSGDWAARAGVPGDGTECWFPHAVDKGGGRGGAAQGLWRICGGAGGMVARFAAAESSARTGNGILMDSGTAVPAQRAGGFSSSPGDRAPVASRNCPCVGCGTTPAGLAPLETGTEGCAAAATSLPTAPKRAVPGLACRSLRP